MHSGGETNQTTQIKKRKGIEYMTMPGKGLEFTCEQGSMEEKQDPEHILKALNSLQTSEEKLAALCKKYADLLEEHRQLQSKFKQSQRKLGVMMREKDQLQSEHSKAVLAKSKLESLCRELQRHNKLVKEESLARAREEEEKRKEVTAKFQTTITDIQSQMNEHYAKNAKLREENIELANKLKSLIEQYELREQHIEKVFKHKELEQQLVDAKLAQANLQMTEEKERNIKEKQVLLGEATEAHKKIQLLEAQETQLRAQIALYTEKYEEFQTTLAKSNEVFQNFKSEMDKMTKKIKKLEKDTAMWRSRWENSNKALLEMAEEKTRSDQVTRTLNKKIAKLENLCRALQAERHKGAEGTKEVEVSQREVEGEEEDETTEPGGVEQLAVSEKEFALTKTPPNTPNDASRASPITVEEAETCKTSQTPESPGDTVDSQSEETLQPQGEENASSQSELAVEENKAAEASQALGDVQQELDK